MSNNIQETVHGTCIAFGDSAALLRGCSGSGKSDLAFRFINLENQINSCDHMQSFHLVADDQVIICTDGNDIHASAPKTILGKIEIRGIGILNVPYIPQATLRLVIDLTHYDDVPRLQFPIEKTDYIQILDIDIPRIKLYPFEASAALKVFEAIKLIEAKKNNKQE